MTLPTASHWKIKAGPWIQIIILLAVATVSAYGGRAWTLANATSTEFAVYKKDTAAIKEFNSSLDANIQKVQEYVKTRDAGAITDCGRMRMSDVLGVRHDQVPDAK